MTDYNTYLPKNRLKHILKAVVCGVLSVVFVGILVASSVFYADGSERYFSGEARDYYRELLEKGFPDDYAVRLTELHLLHPTWEFEPLLITETNPTYTWDYVIRKETEEADTNLISSDSAYRAYRHAFNFKQYDSGYYQASEETVAYFMDPRNFLNETDIFQFFDLSDNITASRESIRAVLKNTFMENAYLENGDSYETYFCKLGETLGINPLYLAVKVRQEQGVAGTSPIISGNCGSLLADYYTKKTQLSSSGISVLAPASGYSVGELRSFNRLYNYFNYGASGDGLFSIYYNAMKRAQTGTPDMAAAWGGSAAWNTRWKSIYGGAYLLKTNYIDRFQGTVYLQKFNVDSRAGDRNFWAQYMQNVTAAMSEARTLYSAFASVGALDMPCTFQIPVYGDMPSKPCRDPANGECTSLLPADRKETYDVTLSSPQKLSGTSAAVYQTVQVLFGTSLQFGGTVEHSCGTKKLEYRLDDGAWNPAGNTGTLNFTVRADFSDGGTHILVIRGVTENDSSGTSRKGSGTFLCAVFYLTSVRSEVSLSEQSVFTASECDFKIGSDPFVWTALGSAPSALNVRSESIPDPILTDCSVSASDRSPSRSVPKWHFGDSPNATAVCFADKRFPASITEYDPFPPEC